MSWLEEQGRRVLLTLLRHADWRDPDAAAAPGTILHTPGGGKEWVVRRVWDSGWTCSDLTTSSGAPLHATGADPEDREVLAEKAAFLTIPTPHLARYEGMFVASRHGEIVEADADLAALTARVFARFGDAPIYITRIGLAPDLRVETPFFEPAPDRGGLD